MNKEETEIKSNAGNWEKEICRSETGAAARSRSCWCEPIATCLVSPKAMERVLCAYGVRTTTTAKGKARWAT